MQKEKSRINTIFETSLNNLKDIVDVNTVVGNPVKLEGNEIVFPIAKVMFGVLTGGGEYGRITVFKKLDELPFMAGNGSIVSIEPCGFLVKDNSGEYKFVSANNNSLGLSIDKIIDLIKKFKADV